MSLTRVALYILTLVPLGRLVEEEHYVFRVVYLKLLLDSVFILNANSNSNQSNTYISWAPRMLLALQIHIWKQDLHPAGSFASQHVRLVLYNALLRSQVILACICLFHRLTVVKNTEFCP